MKCSHQRTAFIVTLVAIFTFPFAATHSGYAQPAAEHWTFLPGRPASLSPVAADQEPRLGLVKEIGSSDLILHIGGVMDLVAYDPDSTLAARCGIEFFTSALSSSIAGHRLQIDAVDGYFGGHLQCSLIRSSPVVRIRLRILHRSAHFVDGHFDEGLNLWRGGREPIPFTKDFGDLLVSCGRESPGFTWSVYSGISYTTLIRPETMRRVGSVHGIEVTSGSSCGTAFGRPFVIFAAYNLSLDGIPAYAGTSSLIGGVKFGHWAGDGIRVVAGYRSGLELFGQYYNVRQNTWSIGLLFDV